MQARGLEMMRKLALIVSFCLGTVASPAFALGLGEIELQSALNEPLRAEIPLFAVRSGQRDLITARIADTEAFARAGVERHSILSDIRFSVVAGPASDQAILQLKTATPVREPFLSMVIEVTSPEGRLIREYTALVDPPGSVMSAPRSSTRPADTGGFATRPYEPAGEPSSRVSDAGAHDYGPVRADETLWSIAYAQRPSDSVTMDQMMLAIYEANPQAFDGSINRIRAGSMLRIPSTGGIRATSPEEARRAVARQRRGSPAPGAERREEAVESPARAVAPPPAEAEPAPAPKPKGELRLSTPEGSAPAPTAPQGDTLPAAPPPPVVEEAPSVPPPATEEGAPATVEAPAPATPRSSAPIEVRDNSAKALELLAVHAREYAAQQAAGDPLAAETAPQAPTTPAPVAEAPAAPPVAPESAAPAPTPAEPTAPPSPPAATDSPFADQPTTATPSSPAEPAPTAEQPPPAVESPAPPASPPAPATPTTVDSGAVSSALNPLLLGLGAAALLLIGLAAVKLRQRRGRRPVTLAPIVLSEVEPAASTFGQTLETPAPRPAGQIGDTLQSTTPPAARTVETTMQSTMPPERTTQQFMAVSTPQPSPPPPPAAAPGGVDPYADALSEVDIHIAYGLYDEAARLLQEPLAKSPERKDLHLKLLEVYFSANLPNEFEAQAKVMRSIVGNDADPDWQKACIMGQQLCPTSTLFAAGAGAGATATADTDFTSLLGSAPAATPTAAAPPASTPSMDFGGLDLGLDKAATVKPPPKPAAPPPPPEAAPAAEANTLDFNLDDFKLDVPASISAPPAKAAAAADDAGLDIDLSDFDVGAPPAPAAAPAAAPAGADVGMDDLLITDAVEGAAEQADTRLDLARAYMDMGEPAMAQSLLQEVIAQGNPGQKQEAQELLNRLNAG